MSGRMDQPQEDMLQVFCSQTVYECWMVLRSSPLSFTIDSIRPFTVSSSLNLIASEETTGISFMCC